MEYTIQYKSIKHAYVRVRDGKLVITMSHRLKGDKKILGVLLKKGEGLLQHQSEKEKVVAFGDEGTTIFGEYVSWEELGLQGKTLATKEKYLKQMLLEYTEELTHQYAQQLSQLVGKSYTCNSVKIKKMKAKWGYCTSEQNIVYALQLLHLPNICIRYVIIHEVCHLKQKDHSSKFWGLVEQLCPNYKKIKKIMKGIHLC